MKHWKTGNDAR